MSEKRDLILICAGAALGLGTLFGIVASSYDFPCIEGYEATGLASDLPKGQALIAAAKFSLVNLSSVPPTLVGFALLFFAAMIAPLLAPDKSHQRILMGLALLPLILGGLALVVLTGPELDCASHAIAPHLLKRFVFGAVGLYGAVWILGRLRDAR